MRRGPPPHKWIAERGAISPFEAALRGEWDRKESQKSWAYLHVVTLFAATGLTWLLSDGAARLSSDHLVSVPMALPAACLTGFAAALLLWLLVWRGIRPRLFGRAAKWAWLTMLPACLLFVSLAFVSRGSTQAGEAVRAQIAGFEGSRRGPFRSGSTLLALQDGSTVSLRGRTGNRHRCLLVRRISGSFGFEWLRIEAASPSPGRGQLNWPIAREACFSDRPLASLRG